MAADDLSFSLATPSDSESDVIDNDPTFATAAAADAPEAVDAAAAAEDDVPGLTTPPASYSIGTLGDATSSSSVGPSVAASVASWTLRRRLSLSLFASFGAMMPDG
jgi:hypothetical protein